MNGPTRDRLVNFRVSEEEYERMKVELAASGLRSMSELARRAVLDRLSNGERWEAAVAELRERVAKLEALARHTGPHFISVPPLASVALGLTEEKP